MGARETIMDLPGLFQAQQKAFAGDSNPPRQVRDDRLARLEAMTEKYGKQVAGAISADFGNRSRQETELAEMFVVLAGIRYARRKLKKWMRPRKPSTALHFRPGYVRVLRQPLGVIGIVSPWNYPYQLAVAPATEALAAGNRAMIKPSELTPRFSELFQGMVSEFFAPDEVAVVTGDAEVGRRFVSLPFDHLFFTGSTAVGRMVAQAAAANLTPVTLELGGKSPAILDESCNLEQVALKLAVGKLLNAGQTCIAPDYVLLAGGGREREEALVAALRRAVARIYPAMAGNADYTSIVSDRHFGRLVHLLDDARAKGARVLEINPGNEEFDPARRKMPPHLVLDPADGMSVMEEEIFGPVLPIVRVGGLGEAIHHVNRRARPLALYWFGTDTGNRDRVLAETIAGGVTINDTLWHIAQEDLPFGGVGDSGQGSYHGEAGFLTFTKEKPVFFQSRLNGAALFYPPYGKTFDRMLGLLRKLV